MRFRKTKSDTWFVKVRDDGTETPSFTNKGEIGKQLWGELQKWIAQGNTPDEIPEEPENEKIERLFNKMQIDAKCLLDKIDVKITKPDKWEYYTDEEKLAIKNYKQGLRDMNKKHTTIKQLENQVWPVNTI